MTNSLLASAALIGASLTALAQVPFPLSNATWVNTFYTYTFNPPNPIPNAELTHVSNYCVNGEDTLIQSITYTKVWYCGGLYKGALRDDNGTVYFVPANSTDEYLLYDFNAQQGQTLTNVYVGNHFDETFMLQEFTVSQTATVDIGGLIRRVVYASDFRWIEGIGCETGLFMEPWGNVSMYAVYLECFSVSGQTIFPTEANGDCDLTVGLTPHKTRSGASVFPNPTTGQIGVSAPANTSIALLQLTDLVGRVLATTKPNAPQATWHLKVPTGIYSLAVTSSDGSVSTHRVVVE